MTTVLSDSQGLLAAAEDLMRHPAEPMVGLWPRASAFLARQALESVFSEVLAVRTPGIERASARAQLLCIQLLVGDKEAARRGILAWIGLSDACHHHPYELPSTALELAGWIESVRHVISVIGSELGDTSA